MSALRVTLHVVIIIDKDFVQGKKGFISLPFVVPTVNTKAEVRFHVHTADWIPEEVRKDVILKVRKEIKALCCVY